MTERVDDIAALLAKKLGVDAARVRVVLVSENLHVPASSYEAYLDDKHKAETYMIRAADFPHVEHAAEALANRLRRAL